jgi:hypothetical protein
MKRLIRSAFRAAGFDIVRHPPPPEESDSLPPDVTAADRAILDRVAAFTMTNLERQISLIQSVRYLVRHRIPGCIVECGVWRGGSMMAAALTLLDAGDTSRALYLYDTFEGMSPPTDVDRNLDGTLGRVLLERATDKSGWTWAVAGLDDVRRNMGSTGYQADRVTYVQGPVESTLPARCPPGPIALLRLDTDWYESTKCELENLFPLVSIGGILIVDDYGHWEGARKAVDDYFTALDRPYYLHRIDCTGRLLVKA